LAVTSVEREGMGRNGSIEILDPPAGRSSVAVTRPYRHG